MFGVVVVCVWAACSKKKKVPNEFKILYVCIVNTHFFIKCKWLENENFFSHNKAGSRRCEHAQTQTQTHTVRAIGSRWQTSPL